MLRASQGGRVCCAGQGHRRLTTREMNHATRRLIGQPHRPALETASVVACCRGGPSDRVKDC